VNKSTPVQVSSLTGITAIAAGGFHSIFLKNDGTVWAVGYNAFGQLGDGTTANKSTPVQVSSLTGITAIAAGGFHSIFLKNDGTVWAVGSNGDGQLGDGTTGNKSTPVQVSVLCVPLSASISSQTNVSCNGGSNGSATVTASGGAPPYSYSWSNGQTTATATGLSAGMYTVTVTDITNSTASVSVTITQPVALIASISSSTNVACYGDSNGSATATVSGGTPPYSYSWSNGQTIATATGLSVGTYTVTVTDFNGCSSTAQITITGNALPNVMANASATAVCAGGQVTLTGSGAASYTWSGGVTNGVAFTPSSTATYTVTGTDANGCSNTDQVTVTVNALPNVTANASATAVCAGGQVTLTGSGAASYSWTGGVTNGVAFTPANTATYTVTGTDANGCSNTDQITVTVKPLPDVTVSNNANTLTANQAGASYQWIDCNNNNAPISGETSQSFVPSTSGVYAVIVTLNGCSGTSSCQNVLVSGVDAKLLSKLPFSIYPNPSKGAFTIQSSKGGVFELMDVTGKVINIYAITSTQQTVHENLPVGVYFVREKGSGNVRKLIIE
jgi:hypothetical protein